MLEFTVGASALAVGFSGYLTALLDGTPLEIPASLTSASDGVVNLPAIVITLVCAAVLIGGIKLSSRVNQIVVAIKLSVVALVIIVGIAHVKTSNYTPFIPPSQPSSGADASAWKTPLITSIFGLEPAVFGIAGVIAGAAIVFFAFIGFDVVATTAEETKNPQRDVPIGVLASLAIVTVLYIAVSLVITGMQSYRDIDPDDAAPLATAFENVGLHWISDLIAIGATIGLTVVVLILMMGQTRVAFAMARDGLLPVGLAKVHPTFGTPYRITAVTAIMVSVLSGFVPFETLGDLVSIGTLFAFMLVSVGVLILRRTRPDLHRAFRVPGIYVVATASVLLCGYLMLNLIAETWFRFLVWMAIGLVVYFAYGRSHSRLGRGDYDKHTRPADAAADPTRLTSSRRILAPKRRRVGASSRRMRRLDGLWASGRADSRGQWKRLPVAFSEMPATSSMKVSPPFQNENPAPVIIARSMSCGAATTPSSSIRRASSARPDSVRSRTSSAVSTTGDDGFSSSSSTSGSRRPSGP